MSTHSGKGLLNLFGHNNCFLNVCIQVLWQNVDFRDTFLRKISPNPKTATGAALARIFRRFDSDINYSVCSDDLRRVLAKAFQREGRFELREMDDAADAFEALLDLLATEDGLFENCSMILSPVIFIFCSRCNQKNSFQIQRYSLSISVMELLKLHQTLTFPDIVRHLILPDHPTCSNSKCQKRLDESALIQLSKPPSNVALTLGWSVSKASDDDIFNVFQAFSLSSSEMRFHFDTIFDDATPNPYLLTAIICFYGLHYLAFVRDSTGIWRKFDDSKVTEIGYWQDLVGFCVTNYYQPVMLHFQPAMYPKNQRSRLQISSPIHHHSDARQPKFEPPSNQKLKSHSLTHNYRQADARKSCVESTENQRSSELIGSKKKSFQSKFKLKDIEKGLSVDIPIRTTSQPPRHQERPSLIGTNLQISSQSNIPVEHVRIPSQSRQPSVRFQSPVQTYHHRQTKHQMQRSRSLHVDMKQAMKDQLL